MIGMLFYICVGIALLLNLLCCCYPVHKICTGCMWDQFDVERLLNKKRCIFLMSFVYCKCFKDDIVSDSDESKEDIVQL